MDDNQNVALFALERREQICELLQVNSKVTVAELCGIFHVSAATIRSDLRRLSSENKLMRTHGGAIIEGKATFEPTSVEKEVSNISEKNKIAEAAVQFIESGDTIALDTGTTTFELCKHLGNKSGLTIVTNDIRIASYLELHSEATIILTGGEIRRGLSCTTGPITLSGLTNINVDKAFMATNAFSIEKGFTTPAISQSEVKRRFIAMASEVYMLADSSKIGRISFSKFADIQDIHVWIIDSNISKRAQKAIAEMNPDLKIHIV